MNLEELQTARIHHQRCEMRCCDTIDKRECWQTCRIAWVLPESSMAGIAYDTVLGDATYHTLISFRKAEEDLRLHQPLQIREWCALLALTPPERDRDFTQAERALLNAWERMRWQTMLAGVVFQGFINVVSIPFEDWTPQFRLEQAVEGKKVRIEAPFDHFVLDYTVPQPEASNEDAGRDC